MARALAIAEQTLTDQKEGEEEEECQIVGVTQEGSQDQEGGNDEEKQKRGISGSEGLVSKENSGRERQSRS